jgi:hypothetical protein
MIPNGELTEGDIPPGADWRDIIPFALTFDIRLALRRR